MNVYFNEFYMKHQGAIGAVQYASGYSTVRKGVYLIVRETPQGLDTLFEYFEGDESAGDQSLDDAWADKQNKAYVDAKDLVKIRN